MKILDAISALPLMFAEGLNAAETNLGGGAPEGAEPDIFAGVDDGAGADSDTGSQGDANDQGGAADDAGGEAGDLGADDDAAGADEGADAAEGEDSQGSEEEVVEGEDEEQQAPPKPGDQAPAAPKKPLTEEEKKVEATLQEAYRENPKLKEALKQFPELRGEFFRAAQLNKIYPTLREAEQAKQWSMELFNIDRLYYGNTPESKREFLKLLWEENLDSTGKSSGHFEQVQEMMTADTLDAAESLIAQNPNIVAEIAPNFKPEQARVAIEVVRRLLSASVGRPLQGAGLRDKVSPEAAAAMPQKYADMTPRERKLAMENEQLKSQVQSKTELDSQTAEQKFNKSVYDDWFSSIKPVLDKRAPSTVKGIKLLSSWFDNEVISRVHKALASDEFFDRQLESATRAGDRSPQHIKQIAEMMSQRAQLLIPTIARQIADELKTQPATGSVTRPNNGQGTNRARGTERPRREPATGGTPGRLSKPAARPSNRVPAHQAGPKTTGDYSRDADKILGIDE